jgi:excisionase family DNA binding protein
LEEEGMIFTEARVYSPAQAASVLGVSTERVRQLGHAGRLPCTRTPLGRLFDADAVDAMARERAQRAIHMGRR